MLPDIEQYRRYKWPIAIAVGAVLGVLLYQYADRVLRSVFPAGGQDVQLASVEIDKYFARIGPLSGGALPSVNDESILIKFPSQLTRRVTFSLDITFQRPDDFLQGEVRRVRLIGAQGLSVEPKTRCENAGNDASDNEVACVKAEGTQSILTTGWLLKPQDSASHTFIVDFTQAPEYWSGQVSFASSDSRRIESDDYASLVVRLGEEERRLSSNQTSASIGKVNLDFEGRKVQIGPLNVRSELNLTARQESIAKLGIGFIGFLLGNGIIWRIFRQSENRS